MYRGRPVSAAGYVCSLLLVHVQDDWPIDVRKDGSVIDLAKSLPDLGLE